MQSTHIARRLAALGASVMVLVAVPAAAQATGGSAMKHHAMKHHHAMRHHHHAMKHHAMKHG